MNSKTTLVTVSRKFTALLLSSAVICSSFVQVLACGFYEEDEAHYTLIPTEKLSWDPYAPYYLSGYTIFGRNDDPDILLPSNYEAWEKYFGINNREALLALIFESSEPSLLNLIQSIQKESGLPEEWKNNPLAQQLAKSPKAAVLDYLKFSKRVETYALQNSDWWDDPQPKDSLAMQQLLAEGEKLLKKTKDKELKTRYAFQLLKLKFYLADYEGVNKQFIASFSDNNWNNKLKYQALSYDFGASWRLAKKKEVVTVEEKASLILKLSKTFQKCEDCPLLLFEDLHYFNAEDYFSAATVLTVPQEKIDLWMLAALRSIPSHIALEKILEIDPNAPEIASLLERILSNSQAARFKHSEATTTDYFASEEWNQTIFTLKKASINKVIKDRAQYAFLMAYFNYIGGKFKKAREELESSALLPGSENPHLAYQQRILRSLLDLETWTPTNLDKAHLLVGQLNEVLAINHADLTTYTFRRLEELAEQNGSMPLERLLFKSMYASIEGDLAYNQIAMLEASYHNKEKSTIERWIWKQQRISINQIGEWKGDALLAMHRFEEAEIAYRTAGNSQALVTDPFTIHLVDCHDCDHRDKPGTLTRLQFAQKMTALDQKAQKGDAQAALDYAHGLYNITWYGNSRDAINTLLLESDATESFSSFFAMDKQYTAYQRALKLAVGKEKKAFALFMLAKCEQNTYFTKKAQGDDFYFFDYDHDPDCDPVKNQEYRKNFALLKSSYANTEFYKLAIKECTYFEHYVRKH